VNQSLNIDFIQHFIYNPYNLEQKWNDRPTWQKAVLIIHLALVAAMFGFGIGLNDK
jgi:hypothetical protein